MIAIKGSKMILKINGKVCDCVLGIVMYW